MRIWAFERGALWAVELDRQTPALVPPRLGAAFGEVQRQSAEALAAAMGLPQLEPVLRRLAAGRRCFAAWIDDRIAAYGWVSQAAECIGELERKIQLLAGEAYVWDCATLPAYRRQGLYSALLSQIVAELCREGLRRVWIGSSLGNRPSIRGFANAGFQPVVTLVYVRIFSLRCVGFIGDRGAPRPLVTAARRALTAHHEHAWGDAASKPALSLSKGRLTVVLGRSEPARFPGCVQIEG